MNPKISYSNEGKIKWILIGISDATWGEDKYDGKSVTGVDSNHRIEGGETIRFDDDAPFLWMTKKL
jgi:hypothetical protein